MSQPVSSFTFDDMACYGASAPIPNPEPLEPDEAPPELEIAKTKSELKAQKAARKAITASITREHPIARQKRLEIQRKKLVIEQWHRRQRKLEQRRQPTKPTLTHEEITRNLIKTVKADRAEMNWAPDPQLRTKDQPTLRIGSLKRISPVFKGAK